MTAATCAGDQPSSGSLSLPLWGPGWAHVCRWSGEQAPEQRWAPHRPSITLGTRHPQRDAFGPGVTGYCLLLTERAGGPGCRAGTTPAPPAHLTPRRLSMGRLSMGPGRLGTRQSCEGGGGAPGALLERSRLDARWRLRSVAGSLRRTSPGRRGQRSRAGEEGAWQRLEAGAEGEGGGFENPAKYINTRDEGSVVVTLF